MKQLLLALFLCSSVAFAQISGAGQLGCNAAPVAGTAWNSGTSNNSTQILGSNIAGANVLVTLDQTTTLTGGAISLLGDPGDGNFVTLNAWQVVDPTSSTYAQISLPYSLQASTNKQFLIMMAGYYRLQLKLTTAISGTGAITPSTTLVCYQTAQPVIVPALPSLVAGSATIGAVNQAGTWTVQPGNTANTTAWLVTGTGGTFPATQSGNWTARVVGNAGSVVDAAPGSAPTNAWAVQGVASMTPIEVSPTTAANSASNPFFQEPSDGTNGMGAMVNWASVPTAVKSLNANVASFPIPTTSSTVAFAAAPYTTNATSTSTYTNVKSSAGNVYAFDYYNPNTSVCWLQFYNATVPTVGTSVIFAVPLFSNGTSGGGHIVPPFPVNFSTAISIATTTTATGSTECPNGIGLTLWYQ